MNILLIEDSKTLRHLTGGYIREDGHSLICAESGEIAVQILEENTIDLIVTDVDMPGLCGFDTVKLVREILGERWVPIIMLTSRQDETDYTEGFGAGVDDYLVKPVSAKLLQAKIRVMERFINLQHTLDETISAKAAEQQFDPVSRCLNTDSFKEFSDLQWKVLARKEAEVSLLKIEIDFYDGFLKTHSAEKVKQHILSIANALRKAASRPNDFVGYCDNACFKIMLPYTSDIGTETIARRINDRVRELHIENRHSPLSGEITLTITGITCPSPSKFKLERAFEKLHTLHNDYLSIGNSVHFRKLI